MPRRVVVNRSNYKLLTGEMNQLLPIGIWETLPNEVVSHRTSIMIRLSPLAAPIYQPITARVLHFFAPFRILWPLESCGEAGNNWEEFVTGGQDGQNAFNPPTIDSTGQANDLLDYLGVTPRVAGVKLNALPVYAINKMFNYWFRDQDLMAVRDKADTTIPQLAWEKDYFTTARPFEQRGAGITIPLGDKAWVTHDATNTNVVGAYAPNIGSGVRTLYTNNAASDPLKAGSTTQQESLYADLSTATGISVTDLRKATALQTFQENMAKYGARYVEYLKRSFGSRPLDSRLQEVELLGGGRAPINISEVLQTAPDETGNERYGVSDMWGHGVAAMRHNGYRYRAPEHGYIISVLSVRPKAMYVDGIERHWLKTIKEDYYQRELRAVAQQPIYNNEVYADSSAEGMDPFGYQDPYSEYRFSRSSIAAEFRDVLKYWHQGRIFETKPVLNEDFVAGKPTKRIHKEQNQHALWIMAQHRMRVASPIGKNPELHIR